MNLATRTRNIPNHGSIILTVSIVLATLSTVVVLMRFYRRLIMSGGKFGIDDSLIGIAWLMSVGHSIGDVISVVQFGYGKHEVDLPADIRGSHRADLLFWVSQLLYKSCILFTKESILFLYLRLFNVGNSRFRIAVFTVMGVVALYYTIVIILTVLECTPIARSWDKTMQGTCIDVRSFFFANAAFNVASDVMVMLLPIPVIARLHLKKGKKLALAFLFFLGFFATTTSIVRFFTLNQGGKNEDISWTTGKSTIWSCIEINMAVICACLPIIRAPLQTLFPFIFGRQTTNREYSSATVSTNYIAGGVPPVSQGWSKISRNTGPDSLEMRDIDSAPRKNEKSDGKTVILKEGEGEGEGLGDIRTLEIGNGGKREGSG